jgi:hypothetical protein
MTTIQKTSDSTANQAVTQPTTPQTKETEKTSESDFDVTLKAFITPNSSNQVSEEALFSALIKERIQSEQGEDGLKAFQEILGKQLSSHTKSDGYVAVEDATKAALIEYRTAGKIDEELANKIYSQAFSAAQLDSNENVLFDDRGGAGDTTIAVASLEQALLASRVKMEKFDSGELTPTERQVDEVTIGKSAFATASSTGHSSGTGSGGFLFKPISDSDGKLAVLLPSIYAGMAQSMRLLSPSGAAIETGRYGGNGNGNREHFRFSQPGQNYPAGVIVEATLTSGETVRYTISNPSQRTENIEPDSTSDSGAKAA